MAGTDTDGLQGWRRQRHIHRQAETDRGGDVRDGGATETETDGRRRDESGRICQMRQTYTDLHRQAATGSDRDTETGKGTEA